MKPVLKSPATNLGCASSAAWNGMLLLMPRMVGFKAVATTSSGFAHAQGCADGAEVRPGQEDTAPLIAG